MNIFQNLQIKVFNQITLTLNYESINRHLVPIKRENIYMLTKIQRNTNVLFNKIGKGDIIIYVNKIKGKKYI